MSDTVSAKDLERRTYEAVVSYTGEYCKENKITHPEDIIAVYDDARRAVAYVLKVLNNHE